LGDRASVSTFGMAIMHHSPQEWFKGFRLVMHQELKYLPGGRMMFIT